MNTALHDRAGSWVRQVHGWTGDCSRVDWMNNRDAPQAGSFDLLVGQSVPDDGGGLHAPKDATFFGPAHR